MSNDDPATAPLLFAIQISSSRCCGRRVPISIPERYRFIIVNDSLFALKLQDLNHRLLSSILPGTAFTGANQLREN